MSTPTLDPITQTLLQINNTQESLAAFVAKEASCHIHATYDPHLIKPRALHQFVGKFVLAGSFRTAKSAWELREKVAMLLKENKYGNWKVRRVPFNIDGNYIDAVVIGSPETLSNRVQKRWMIFSLGCADFYEDLLLEPNFLYLLQRLNTNCLIVNYPNTAQSKGSRSKGLAIQAHKVALHVLENIIQANQIILWQFSLGGGVMAEALKEHAFLPNTRYVKVDMQTFSHLSTAARSLCHLGIGNAIIKSGWEMSPLSTTQIFPFHQIVLNRFDRKGNVVSDGVIPAKASLAFALKQNPLPPNIEIHPIASKHNRTLSPREIDRLVPRILRHLDPPAT